MTKKQKSINNQNFDLVYTDQIVQTLPSDYHLSPCVRNKVENMKTSIHWIELWKKPTFYLQK